MFNEFYEKMKPKAQKDFIAKTHFFNMLNVLTSMFEYNNLPETIRPEILESLLISEGTVGVGKIDGKLWCGPGGYCGEIIAMIPSEYQITVVGKGHIQGKVGEDMAVCWNNNTATPDISVIQFASILGEIDVSEKINVLFSRLLRIPKAKDEKDKLAIEAAIKAIMNGNVEAVVSGNIRDELFEVESETGFLDLVDVKDVDKLQYLAAYRDEIIKRFFQLYGQDLHTNSKRAQQSVEEISGTDAVCMIIPVQKLQQRRRFCEQMNEIFGTNVTVDFSECWLDSMREVIEDSEESDKGVDDSGTDDNQDIGSD